MTAVPPPVIAQYDTAGIARLLHINPRERAYGARGDLQTLLDGASMTAGSHIVTAPNGTFSQRDVNKTLWVDGCASSRAMRTTAADASMTAGISSNNPDGLPTLPRSLVYTSACTYPTSTITSS